VLSFWCGCRSPWPWARHPPVGGVACEGMMLRRWLSRRRARQVDVVSDDEAVVTSARTSSASIDESLESERPRLSVELVPATCWLSNLRSELPRQAWDALRRRTYENAGYLCDVCSGRGPTHPVECHEQWSYDDAALVQRLVCMVALCPACHQVKHLGRAHAIGRGDQARAHLARIPRHDRRLR
jgi:hypothetical protein